MNSKTHSSFCPSTLTRVSCDPNLEVDVSLVILVLLSQPVIYSMNGQKDYIY